MRRLWVLIGGILIASAAGATLVNAALAHTTVQAGSYDIEVGWADEPPIVGQRNAIVINVTDTAATDSVVDISKLAADVTYGGQTRLLTLQPFSEESRNQYVAPVLPTVPGLYTVQLRGQLGNGSISQDVQPEEVLTAETLEFPSVAVDAGPAAGAGTGTWLGAGGLVTGLAALILAILALRKSA